MTILSCACTSARPPGADRDALVLERLEQQRRHVLVVEGHDVAAAGELAQVVEVVVPAEAHVAHGLRRALLDRGGQHPQADAEGDRRLLHHAGELTAADHADDREPRCHVRVRGLGHGASLWAVMSNTAVTVSPGAALRSGHRPENGSVGAVIGSTATRSCVRGA